MAGACKEAGYKGPAAASMHLMLHMVSLGAMVLLSCNIQSYVVHATILLVKCDKGSCPGTLHTRQENHVILSKVKEDKMEKLKGGRFRSEWYSLENDPYRMVVITWMCGLTESHQFSEAEIDLISVGFIPWNPSYGDPGKDDIYLASVFKYIHICGNYLVGGVAHIAIHVNRGTPVRSAPSSASGKDAGKKNTMRGEEIQSVELKAQRSEKQEPANVIFLYNSYLWNDKGFESMFIEGFLENKGT